jgi:GNAT superfamily N-acetyltransferase
MNRPPRVQVVEITDERDPRFLQAVAIIRDSVQEVQPTQDLQSEIEESRRGLRSMSQYHLLVTISPEGMPLAAAAGAYLRGVNVGYIAYLAVAEQWRRARFGTALRTRLVETFKRDALELEGRELSWVVGEVRRKNRWLQQLVKQGKAVPFDISYFHPWQSREREGAYVFYRESIADRRTNLPSAEVKTLIYAIWRYAYRIAYPIRSETFRYMLEQLGNRPEIGVGKI